MTVSVTRSQLTVFLKKVGLTPSQPQPRFNIIKRANRGKLTHQDASPGHRLGRICQVTWGNFQTGFRSFNWLVCRPWQLTPSILNAQGNISLKSGGQHRFFVGLASKERVDLLYHNGARHLSGGKNLKRPQVRGWKLDLKKIYDQ